MAPDELVFDILFLFREVDHDLGGMNIEVTPRGALSMEEDDRRCS